MAIPQFYYVYVYLDPRKPGIYTYGEYTFTHEPFYVGMGVKSRIYEHMRGTKRAKKNADRYNRIEEIKAEGLSPITLKPHHTLTKDQARYYERVLIDVIGRAKLGGPLTNVAFGGEGGSSNAKSLDSDLAEVARKATFELKDILTNFGKNGK